MKELVILENINAIELFSGGADTLIKKISEEAKRVVPDVETAAGRKHIATIASKVAKSKVYLDKLGKALVSDWKTKSKAVDSERKRMRDQLDALKEEIRQPLTDWEQAEIERLQIIKEMVDEFSVVCSELDECTSDDLAEKLAWVKGFAIDGSFEEFANEAARNKDLAISVLEKRLDKVKTLEQEQVELEKLRRESEEREKKDREEKLRLEGEQRARQEAEITAKEESERAEKEKQAAIKAKEDAERRAKQAEENSAREAEAATKAERDRIESERIAEELATKKREDDKQHRVKIKSAAVAALVSSGLTSKQAKLAITRIAQGKVPHITILY